MKFIQKTVPIVVLALYMSPILYSIGSISTYLSNLTYIEENLCENRAKPALSCNGTCVLSKMLNKVNQDVNPFEKTTINNNVELIIGFFQEQTFLINIGDKLNSHEINYQSHFYSFLLVKSLIEPPDFIG